MRVAVTGADGFTGRFVRAALESRGAECVPIEADLCDEAAVRRAVEKSSFDCLIHLAAKAFVNATEWRPFYAVNQIGTFTLLDAVAEARPGTRCILSSSAQVYGRSDKGLIAEDAPVQPVNHYAVSKLAMEQGAKVWNDRIEIIITRPFNYTGMGQGTDYLVPKIVDHFRRNAKSIVLGNTGARRDFGDVRDVAEVYARLASADIVPPILNIATGRASSIDEIIAILTKISGRSLDVVVDQNLVRKDDILVLSGDINKLQSCLPMWQPRGLEQTLGWMYGRAAF